jgi:hypothetical protein
MTALTKRSAPSNGLESPQSVAPVLPIMGAEMAFYHRDDRLFKHALGLEA